MLGSLGAAWPAEASQTCTREIACCHFEGQQLRRALTPQPCGHGLREQGWQQRWFCPWTWRPGHWGCDAREEPGQQFWASRKLKTRFSAYLSPDINSPDHDGSAPGRCVSAHSGPGFLELREFIGARNGNCKSL